MESLGNKEKIGSFDNQLKFQSYYNEKMEQKVKEIEDKISTNVFHLFGSKEWKINCDICAPGHTIKFNARDSSIRFQNGFLDIRW